MRRAAFVLVAALAFALGVAAHPTQGDVETAQDFAAALSPLACTAAQGQAIQTAAGPVAAGALDGITCVTDIASLVAGPTDIASLVQACARFGIDAAGVYQIVASLLKQHQASAMADAGLPDVAAALAPDPLTVHLVAILASTASGK